MRNLCLTATLALVSACGDATTPRIPPTFSVTPATQWSGGVVTIRSEFLAVRGALPFIVSGSDTVIASRVDDSTATVVLPLGPTGPLVLRARRGGLSDSIGVVLRVGYRSRRDHAPGFYGEVVTSVRAGDPFAIGAATDFNNSLQIIDLETGQVTGLPDLFAAEYYGISPTFRPDEFVAKDSAGGAGTAGVWSLWPTPTLVAAAPAIAPSLRHLARLSDSIWLSTSHHYTSSYNSSTATFVFPGAVLSTESPWSIILSPAGDLATMAVSVGRPGVAVFNSLTGDTAYTLGPRFVSSQWAAFSGDGARIYFVGGRLYFGVDSLLSVRASDGAVLAAVALPTGHPAMSMAADPTRPLLYIQVFRDSLPSVLVYETGTLSLVGELTVPAAGPPCSVLCFEGAVAVDRARNTLHIVRPGPPAAVLTFDLLP